MIAMLLAAQLSAEIARGMPIDQIPPPPNRARAFIVPTQGNGLVRIVPMLKDSCPGAGRVETSLAEPTALYRAGDRPAVALRRWVDYPEGRGCLVEAAP
jgi:hypothetical protein